MSILERTSDSEPALGSHEIEILRAQLVAIAAEAVSADLWTRRARPAFLYVCAVAVGATDGLDRCCATGVGGRHEQRHDRLSERAPRAIIRFIWNGLSRIYRRTPMGQD